VVCDDANPCTADSCVDYVGCQFLARSPGTACDDGNPCTNGDACNGGAPPACVGSLLPPGTACDDGNGCTVSESCTAEGQCLGTSLVPGAACDDGNACTSSDHCLESPAGSGNIVCGGTPQTCDDGNPCTVDSCDPTTGSCGAAPRSCDDGNACTQDACDPATGGCLHTATAGSCEDGVFCSVNDFCSGGYCRPGAPRDCGHGGTCSTVYCDNSDRRCHEVENPNACPPPTACRVFDCVGGNCLGRNITGPCSDGNPCTSEQCITGVCTGTGFLNGAPCSDGNQCTTGDMCNNGFCQPGTPLNCDDGNACTIDTCNGTGCVHTYACDDGNDCTTDSCDPAVGCAHSNINAGSCNDHNACTAGDTCVNGSCQGTLLNCNDGNACTIDTCNGTSCVHTDACNDNNGCTIDSCNPAVGCSHIFSCDDGNPCTDDSCSGTVCTHAPNLSPCSDGNACTVGDHCGFGGACQPGTPMNCDDGDPCTADSCNPATGTCQHDAGSGCDDGNPCTTDSCSNGGCLHTNRTGSCDDGNLCTAGDVCSNGTCQPGRQLICDDGNPCTVDSCDPSTGTCQHDTSMGCGSAPIVTVSLSPNILHPSNHKMIDITATAAAQDSFGAPLTPVLFIIESSEADDAPGAIDGHTVNDIQGAEYGTADYSFQLRAERDSTGPGRTYWVTYRATDALGRTGSGSASVVVPLHKNSPLPTTPTEPKKTKEPK